mgnify:CR=1 FL=1
MKRIAVKIGSNVLTRKDGTLDITRMSALVDQVADLHRQGMEIVLISSGAVASGRSEIKAGKKLDPVSARQLYSAVGQAKLINRYYELFREHGMTCGQVLTTKENFGSRTHYLNQKHCMEVMLENKVIPIVNENDTISVTELMFTDNDELSGLIATMMGMDALVILSNIDGIYNGNPSDPDSSVIREIECGKTDLFAVVIAFRYLLPREEFILFKKKLTAQIDVISNSANHITRNELLSAMGFPQNWKDITKYKF